MFLKFTQFLPAHQYRGSSQKGKYKGTRVVRMSSRNRNQRDLVGKTSRSFNYSGGYQCSLLLGRYYRFQRVAFFINFGFFQIGLVVGIGSCFEILQTATNLIQCYFKDYFIRCCNCFMIKNSTDNFVSSNFGYFQC